MGLGLQPVGAEVMSFRFLKFGLQNVGLIYIPYSLM